jgi:hypothetical protein|tara:strand:+ start:3449 stop:3562 length:114 start_codon:yes stop_codon:yes gene_type:complete
MYVVDIYVGYYEGDCARNPAMARKEEIGKAYAPRMGR